MQFLDLAGVKKFKQYVDENFTPVEDHENAEKVAAAALNNLNDRITDIEDGDWVTAEDYSEIESAHLDVYSKEEIDSMLSNIEGGSTGELNTNNSIYQSPNSSESLAGVVNLHRISKTGNYDDLLNKPTYGDVKWSMYRSNVSGSGSLTKTGTLGTEPIPVGTYKVKTYMNSSTSSYTLTSNFGDSYNISTTNGIIDDVRIITLSSSARWTGSITTVASNTVISVIIYSIESDISSVGKVAITNNYADLLNKPTIPAAQVQSDWNATSGMGVILNKPTIPSAVTESTVSGWGFTKNTGTYSKPSGGIPKTDLASAVQTSLGKADTALQSFTETDPVFSASAAAGITASDITNWNGKTSNTGTVTGVKINGTTKNPTSGVVDLGTVLTSETALSKGTITGSGNAVTDISVSGHQITLTKGSTFLTSETSLSKGTTTGSGNAVTDISVSGHQITLTKGNTFLTSHQDISGKANLSGAAFTGAVTGTSSGNGGQFRNITISSSEPTASQGSNGDIWIVI